MRCHGLAKAPIWGIASVAIITLTLLWGYPMDIPLGGISKLQLRVMDTTVYARQQPPLGPASELDVALVLEGCSSTGPTEAEGLACLSAVYHNCTALSEESCFVQAIGRQPECKAVFPRGRKKSPYKDWWLTLLREAAPQLRALGWRRVRILPKFDPTALASADIVILRHGEEGGQAQALIAAGKPSQRLVLVDRADSSVAKWEALLEHPKVAFVLKHVVLEPPELQRGPLLDRFSHVATMGPDAPNLRGAKLSFRNLSDAALRKIQPLLPMTTLHRYPWACGSGLNSIRFAGFFHQFLAHTWRVPRLQDRKIDVAYLGKSNYEEEAGKYITAHRALGRQAMQRFQEEYGDHLHILMPETRMKDYSQYLQTLLDTKILVSPWGWGEWSLKDFEAIMCGCLLVKPLAGRYRTYPDIYHPGITVLSTDQSFRNLGEVLLGALGDAQRAQRIADAASSTFRRYADPEVIAADLSKLLLRALQGEVDSAGRSEPE